MSTDQERKSGRAALRGATLLGLLAVAGAILVAVAHDVTRDRIAENQRQFLLRSLTEILPANEYDNVLHADRIEVQAPELGAGDDESAVYLASKDGQPVAAIFEVTAPDGYSGAIRLLVGIRTDGTIVGVRAIAHRETPGLGDDIDLARSDWILGFNGRSIGNPPLAGWAVERDGGDFDQFTGATITPRAVVKAVTRTLLYFRAHRDNLVIKPPAGS